jgi:hypothetical protein
MQYSREMPVTEEHKGPEKGCSLSLFYFPTWQKIEHAPRRGHCSYWSKSGSTSLPPPSQPAFITKPVPQLTHFILQDSGNMFLRNVGISLRGYTVSQSRWPQCESSYTWISQRKSTYFPSSIYLAATSLLHAFHTTTSLYSVFLLSLSLHLQFHIGC